MGVHYGGFTHVRLPANTRLGQKWLTIVNTLVYYNTTKVSALKSFRVHWAQCYKFFYNRNLRIFAQAVSVCPWQVFKLSNKPSSLVQNLVNYGYNFFIKLTRDKCYKTFCCPCITDLRNKLECLSLGKLF